MNRFLSRREKHPSKRTSKNNSKSPSHVPTQPQSFPADHQAIFSKDPPKSADKDDEKKVKALVQRVHAASITCFGEAQVYYALSMHPDDVDKAYEFLLLVNDALAGTITEYNPDVKMLGAVNRNNVTCYLDALLFAMFARLDSFEAMLFDNFNDDPRKKLAVTLRLWVNLLRTGRLIGVELTEHLQGVLAECGWEEAAEVCQQDASEAFTFITGVLELPLLTLKMDIYHTGREDQEDDHKFVNERLLEVAIPEQEGDTVLTLEACLESYFNNRIEVKRYLQRQNTMGSIRSTDRDPEKTQTLHIETIEVSESSSPMVSTPTSLPPTPISPIRPLEGRRRADSIFSERYRNSHRRASEQKAFDEKRHLDELWQSSSEGRPRATSLRKEVLMPAWQFFSLIPWYTDNVPKSDAQVAAHFSAQRPVLGICLKRYMVLADGSSKRLNTYIDIPLEIGLPHFVSDDRIDENGPLFGNFKLVLQSVVCHRGVQINSGHYIALVRGNKAPHLAQSPKSTEGPSEETPDPWFIFDDLAQERVKEVDIQQTLQEESPYLLFFQVQPIDEELASRGDPPGYYETQPSTADPSQEAFPIVHDAKGAGQDGDWEQIEQLDSRVGYDEPAGRSSMSSNRHSSITFDMEGSVESVSRGRTAPPTPMEEKSGFLSTSRRNSKAVSGGNKSRPTSQSGETRLSLTISRLTGRTSKDKLLQLAAESLQNNANANSNPNPNSEEPLILVHSVKSEEGNGHDTAADTSAGHVKEKEKHHQHRNHSHSSLGRSKSKRGKEKEKEKDKDKDKDWKRLRSKSKDPSGQAQRKTRPDRECVMM